MNYVFELRKGSKTGLLQASTTVRGILNQPPNISISVLPANGLTAPASVTLNAAATDPDGSISKVEFYRDGVLLGSDTVAPYSYSLTNVAAGNYSITAKAYDNLGATTISAAIPISIVPVSNGTPDLISARTLGTDNYSIELQGTNFANNSYVNVMAGTSGSIIAQFSGAQLTRTTSGGNNYLTFNITDQSLRNLLNSTGLYFWVVNPSVPAWDGPLHVINNSSTYDSLGSNLLAQGMRVVLSRIIQLTAPTDLFLQSDGTVQPSTSGSPPAAQLQIYVDGVFVSNTARIDWYGSQARDTHSFNVIGYTALQAGQHQLELRVTATGGSGITVGAGTNLAAMAMKPGAIVSSTTVADQGPYIFNTGPIAAGPYDDRSNNPAPLPYQTVLSQSLNTSLGQRVAILASGTHFQAGNDGDSLVGIWFNGGQTNSHTGSWSFNDICACAELVAPFAAHAMHSATGLLSTVSLGASEFYWSDLDIDNPIKYKIARESKLLTIRGVGVAGIGKGPDLVAPTSMLNVHPTKNIDKVLASSTFNIPVGHNGEILIAAKSRLFGGPGKGTASLKIRLDGQVVGSVGLQDCGMLVSGGCVSGRTLTASYLTAGSNRLQPGNHTLEAVGRFNTLSPEQVGQQHYMSSDGVLIWFDAAK